MTPELLFDRPALVKELSPRMSEWASEMIGILEKHRNDKDSAWVVEDIHNRSMQLGVPMTLACHNSGGS